MIVIAACLCTPANDPQLSTQIFDALNLRFIRLLIYGGSRRFFRVNIQKLVYRLEEGMIDHTRLGWQSRACRTVTLFRCRFDHGCFYPPEPLNALNLV